MRIKGAFTISFIVFLTLTGAAAACNEPYPPSMIKAFMANCDKDLGLKDYCGCLIDSLQKTIPLADFIEVGTHPGGVNSDPRYISANQSCAKKYPLTGNTNTQAKTK
jgi:hypothetical protein